MDRDLEKNIADYYQNLELPKEFMASVKTRYLQKPKKAMLFSWKKWALPVAACVGFILVGPYFISQWKIHANLAVTVAAEISLNHHKFKDPEFNLDEFSLLAQKMDKLDFSPTRPNRMGSEVKVIGARYCSIQGIIAAQIGLLDKSGSVMTLYQSKGIESLKSIDRSVVTVDGLEVSMWIENGLFNGLAKPIK